jgi:hypothetical protein
MSTKNQNKTSIPQDFSAVVSKTNLKEEKKSMN